MRPRPSGVWIEQIIGSVVVVVTFRLALRAIDFLFVLHMKNVTGSLFSGTNSKEMVALLKAYSSKKQKKGGPGNELDDAENGEAAGKKKAGCFGGSRREYVHKTPEEAYADVRLDPDQERAFEERAAWLVKNPETTRSIGESPSDPSASASRNSESAFWYAGKSYAKLAGGGLLVAPWPGMSGATQTYPWVCSSRMSLE